VDGRAIGSKYRIVEGSKVLIVDNTSYFACARPELSRIAFRFRTRPPQPFCEAAHKPGSGKYRFTFWADHDRSLSEAARRKMLSKGVLVGTGALRTES
jgi:hypothetical protein